MAPILYYSPKNWNSSTETKIELAKTWGIYLTKKPWCLVGGLDLFLFFHSVGNFIIPTDELTPSFFRGLGRYTTNQGIFTNKKSWSRLPGASEESISSSVYQHRTGVFFAYMSRSFHMVISHGYFIWLLPSGKRLHNYWKSPFLIGKTFINEP